MPTVKEKINKIKTNSFWRNLFKNSFWAFVGDSGSSLIVLAITVLLIHCIGDEKYGIIVLAETYMYMMDVILNFQSWKSTIQYGQGAITTNRSAVFGWQTELIICAQIMSIEIFFHLSGVSTAILRIMNKFHMVAIQKIITASAKILALFITLVLIGQRDIIVVAWVYCLSDILGNILLVCFALFTYGKKYGIKKTIMAKFPKDSRKFVSFTLWSTVEGIADIPVSQLDVFVVSIIGNQAVAIFKVYKQITNILRKVTSPIQQSIMPQFSDLSARNKKKEGYGVVIKIRNAILKVCLPVAIILGLSSPVWLALIYGDAYAAEWYVLLLFLIIQTFALSYTTIHPFYLSLGKPKSSALILFVANIIYAIVAFLLIEKVGLLAMAIAYAIQCLICVYLKVRGSRKEIAKIRLGG